MSPKSAALVPHVVRPQTHIAETGWMLGGIALLAILAQVSIPLPFTPVPITGQTFGVMLVSLLWGAKRGSIAMSLYLLIGSLGAPVFAAGRSGFVFGPTLGYLVGMWLAAIIAGTLADRGWSKSFGSAYIACMAGSICVFTCGLAVLSKFVPGDFAALVSVGLLPFIPGDILKSGLAALIVSQAHQRASRSQ